MQQVMAVSAALIVGASLSGGAAAAKAPCCKKSLDAPTMKAQLQAAADGLKPIASAVDLKHWTPEFVVATVGKERAALHQWVHRNTRYVPYEGALRGPTGVLWDRLGNNLDRALLLVALLHKAGHKARLVQGAARRVPKVPEGPPPAVLTGAQLSKRVTTLLGGGARARSDIAALVARAERFSKATALAGGLWKQVEPHLRAATAPRETSHWWVEVAAGADWEVLDPANSKPGVVAPGSRGGKVVARLSPRLEHRITVSVVAEQRDGAKRATHKLVTASVSSRAAVGETIAVHFSPIKKAFPDLLGGDAAQRDATIASWARGETEWVPVLTVAGKTHKKRSFDVYGRPNDKPGKPHAMSAATSALDMLGRKSTAKKKPTGVLESVWVEMRFDVPGRPATTERRVVYRRDPAATPEVEALRRGLATATTARYAVLPATPPPERAAYVPLRLFSRHGARLLKAVDAIYSGSDKRVRGALGFVPNVPIRAMVWSFARMAMSPMRAQLYVSAPNVVGQVRQLALDASGRKLLMRDIVDVIANPVDFLGGGDARRLALVQGVVDTEAETILRASGDTVRNASERLRSDNGEGWRVLAKPSEVASSGVPRGLAPEIERVLADGSVVVIEGRRGAAAADFSWWRVRRDSSAALGMTGGFGQASTEYVSVTILAALKPLMGPFNCMRLSRTGVKRKACVSCVLFTLYAAAVGATMQLSMTMAASGPAPTATQGGGNSCARSWGHDRVCAGLEGALAFYRRYAERTEGMRRVEDVCGIGRP